MSDRTVAIVGAGLAGLAAGVALARRGVRVEVFEARANVGGCCANEVIEGFTFHDGALYLAMAGVMGAAFERLGLDLERLVPLRQIEAFAAQLADGSRVTVGRGRGQPDRADGRGSAPIDAEIDELVTRWRPVLRLFTEDLMLRPLSLGRLATHGWRHLPRLGGRLAPELRRAFRDEAVPGGDGRPMPVRGRGMATFGDLVAPGAAGRRMRRKVERAPLSHRAVGVQLGLAHDIGTRTHVNTVLPMLPDQHRVFTGAETGRWPTWSLPTVAAPEPSPAGGSIVEPFAPVGPSSDEGDAEARLRSSPTPGRSTGCSSPARPPTRATASASR